MTQEDKAKRYDKLFVKASRIYNKENDVLILHTIEDLFPELKESEDERIRKDIIAFLTYYHTGQGNSVEYDDGWIAWLEKQGEQNLADKVKPKFKVGDIITNDIIIGKVDENENNKYHGWFGYDKDLSVHYADIPDIENWHKWTIQDAKDGNVLHSIGWHNDCIFIFNGIDNWKFDEPNGDRAVATGYCCLFVSADKMEFGMQGPDCIEVDKVKPATKIQRDLLFQKMKDAGYEWDAEKKELKKIEQNTDEYIEVKGLFEIEAESDELTKEMSNEKHNLTDFERTLADICIGWIGEEPGWKEYIKDNADVLLKIAVKKFNSVQDAPFEQKPAWSEEDNIILSKIIADYERSNEEWFNAQNSLPHGRKIIWLKSLKDRVQPKQEWSMYDETILKALIDHFEYKKEFNEAEDYDIVLWLKSLRPQNRWKPSEEQMKAVKEAACYSSVFSEKTIDNLILLSKQLKKLREE